MGLSRFGQRRAGRLLMRGLRLRCPRCGARTLFRSRFSMYADCVNCGLVFEREQGYFVGAIYVNYAATVVIVFTGFFVLDRFLHATLTWQLIVWGLFAVIFPMLFFRHARSLWLSLDYLFNPGNGPENTAE